MTTQTLDEFEQLLEESFAKSNTVADIVEGTIIKKENEGYLVSVKGAKMEAFLPARELSSDSEELEVGDIREFYVLKEENNEDAMQLSLKRIAYAQAWAQLNDAKIQGDTKDEWIVSSQQSGIGNVSPRVVVHIAVVECSVRGTVVDIDTHGWC